MAIDKLVDSTKLDNSLSYEASRIRLKTGGSANLSFDFTNEKGFGDAIDAISTGAIDINALADGSISGAVEITASSIRDGFFKECRSITSLTCPNATVIRQQFCSGCSSLVSVSLPNATTVNSTQQFIGCTSLTTVNLPKLETPGGNMFQGCTALAFIDLPALTRLSVTRVFYGCSNLKTVILRNNNLVALNNDVFTNTPFASGGSGGTVYVPQALISSYQTATNWSTLYSAGTCTFSAIEGSAYE